MPAQALPCMPGKAELVGVSGDGRDVVRLLCSLGSGADGTPQEWIHILPGGPIVVARDERVFQVTDAESVLAASELPMLVDWEHESENPWGGSTRAAGWIEELSASDGSERAAGLWGRVRWTGKGGEDVAQGAYRFLSPVVVIDSETRDAQQIVSVALTNRPALRMQEIGRFREQMSARIGVALDGERAQAHSKSGEAMTPAQRKALCAAFSLAETVSDDEIVEAAKKHSAARVLLEQTTEQFSSASASLAQVNARVVELETQLSEARKAGEAARLEAEIAELFQANKNRITPAMAEGFRKMFAKSPETLEAFKEFTLPNLPEIGAPAPASIPATAPSSASSVAERDRLALRQRGMTDAQIEAAEKYQAEVRARRALGGEVD